MSRIAQQLLDFKLEATSETITSHAGLAVLFETALALNVIDDIRTHLPRLGSNRAHQTEEFVMSLVLMLAGGGQALEGIRQIADDQGLRDLCRLQAVPGPDALGRWLRRQGNLQGMKLVNRKLTSRIIARSPRNDFTLDIDATFMETNKNCARICYDGYKAFSALTSYVPELGGLCVASEYRNGNVSPTTGINRQLKSVLRLFRSAGKRLKYFRSDSAACRSDVINTCLKHKVTFVIAGDQNAAVKELIADIPDSAWERLYDRDHIYRGRQYARVRHCMEKTTEAFDLIVIRWVDTQRNLFEGTLYCYRVIATNDYERSSQEVIWFYDERGNAENCIKELKGGFGMEYAPSRELRGDAVYFEIGVLAYNLTIAFKMVQPGEGWLSKTIRTLRWELMEIAGKVVRHGRQLILRVMECCYEVLAGVRSAVRSWVTANTG